MINFNEFLDDSLWCDFYSYVCEKGSWTKEEQAELKDVIDSRKYVPAVERLLAGEPFDPPTKHLISKTNSSKKRAVYSFSYLETLILKILARKLHEYDYLFSDNLYSFRTNHNPQNAFLHLTRPGAADGKFSYKVDISNYFNSIPVDEMLRIIRGRIDDEALCTFFERLLTIPYVRWEEELICETKGIMAGNPVAAFLANLYLADVDENFEGCLYARYSDDIILFADSEEERDRLAERLKALIRQKGLEINSDKEIKTGPHDPWTFLGITRHNGVSDISKVSIDKLKGKLHRKARAIERWKRHKGATPEQAVKAYIKAVNRKLYDNKKSTELTWVRWYFPLINTDTGLRELDHYIQSCIRYVAYGNYGKKSFNFKYDDMKALGYRSLVHEYYNQAGKKDSDVR